MDSYGRNAMIEMEQVPYSNTPEDSIGELLSRVDDDTAAVIVQYPDFFGRVCDYSELAEELHKKKEIINHDCESYQSGGIEKLQQR